MAGIRSLQFIVERYKRITPGRAREFEEGVKNPKEQWEPETIAAAEAYNDGVRDAIERGAFAGGVRAAGQSHYVDMSLRKGVPRFRHGVEIGIPFYQRNFAPFREVIAGVELPPRKPKGDPSNLERVAVIAQALHAERRRRQAGK